MLAVRRSSLNILTKTVRTVSPSTVRAFTVTAYKNELLQDLFLKELKNTKFDMASLQSPESIAENVIKFSAPTKPKIPTLEAAQRILYKTTLMKTLKLHWILLQTLLPYNKTLLKMKIG